MLPCVADFSLIPEGIDSAKRPPGGPAREVDGAVRVDRNLHVFVGHGGGTREQAGIFADLRGFRHDVVNPVAARGQVPEARMEADAPRGEDARHLPRTVHKRTRCLVVNGLAFHRRIIG